MRISPSVQLTLKNIRDEFSSPVAAFTLLIQPILWLSIFLFLREEEITINTAYGDIRYVDFLVVGILVWRMVSHILSRTSKTIQRSALRSVLTAPNGDRVLLCSSVISTVTIGFIIAVCIIVTSIVIYNFHVFLERIVLALFVLALVIIIHVGIAIALIMFARHVRDAKSIGFMVTTIFGLLSGVFFPPQYFPYPLNQICYILPLTQGLQVIRSLTLFNNILPDWNLITLLVAEAAIILGGSIVFYRRSYQYLSR